MQEQSTQSTSLEKGTKVRIDQEPYGEFVGIYEGDDEIGNAKIKTSVAMLHVEHSNITELLE